MKKTKKIQVRETKARQRAEIIMKVRSGLLTATEGAAALGISRKTYYKWENRALDAMLDGLEDRETGRPELPGSLQNEIDLNKKIEELHRENELLEKKIELQKMMNKFEIEKAREKQRKAKSSKKKKRKTGRS